VIRNFDHSYYKKSNPAADTIGMIFALGSLIPLEIWDIMVALKLFSMAKGDDLKI
jgi:hypothetical protein